MAISGGEVGEASVSLRLSLSKLDGDLRQAQGQIQREVNETANRLESGLGGALMGVNSRVEGVFGAVTSLKNLFLVGLGIQAAAAVGSFVYSIGQAGEEIEGLRRRANRALGTDMGFDIAAESALRLRTSVATVVPVMQRLAFGARELGLPVGEVQAMTEGLILLGKVGGTTGAELDSVLMQFSQAFSSGRLQGEELNSILEGMPALAKALSTELGVGVGELKKLAENGEITASVMRNAVLKAAQEARKELEALPATMSEGLNRLGAAYTSLLAALDQKLDVSGNLAEFFSNEAKSIEGFAVMLGGGTIPQAVDALKGKLGELQGEITETADRLAAMDRENAARGLTEGTTASEALRAKLEELKGEAAGLQERIDALNGKLSEAKGQMLGAVQPAQDLAAELRALGAAAASLSVGPAFAELHAGFGSAAEIAGKATEAANELEAAQQRVAAAAAAVTNAQVDSGMGQATQAELAAAEEALRVEKERLGVAQDRAAEVARIGKMATVARPKVEADDALDFEMGQLDKMFSAQDQAAAKAEAESKRRKAERDRIAKAEAADVRRANEVLADLTRDAQKQTDARAAAIDEAVSRLPEGLRDNPEWVEKVRAQAARAFDAEEIRRKGEEAAKAMAANQEVLDDLARERTKAMGPRPVPGAEAAPGAGTGTVVPIAVEVTGKAEVDAELDELLAGAEALGEQPVVLEFEAGGDIVNELEGIGDAADAGRAEMMRLRDELEATQRAGEREAFIEGWLDKLKDTGVPEEMARLREETRRAAGEVFDFKAAQEDANKATRAAESILSDIRTPAEEYEQALIEIAEAERLAAKAADGAGLSAEEAARARVRAAEDLAAAEERLRKQQNDERRKRDPGYDASETIREDAEERMDVLRNSADVITSTFDDVGEAATGFFMGQITAAEALTSVVENLTEKLIEMALNALVLGVIEKSIGAGFGTAFAGGTGTAGGVGAGAGAGTAGGGGITPGTVYHQGTRSVGTGGGQPRMLPTALFASAPRYHEGNAPGLKPREVAAVLEEDEAVITRRQIEEARAWLAKPADVPRMASAGGPGAAPVPRAEPQPIRFNLTNASGVPVEARETGRRQGGGGGVEIDVMLTKKVAQIISSGKVDRPMQRFGVAPAVQK